MASNGSMDNVDIYDGQDFEEISKRIWAEINRLLDEREIQKKEQAK